MAKGYLKFAKHITSGLYLMAELMGTPSECLYSMEKNGIIVVDYTICDQEIFVHIANFMLKQPSPLSDHSPIVTWLSTNHHLCGSEQQSSNQLQSLERSPKQFLWKYDSGFYLSIYIVLNEEIATANY